MATAQATQAGPQASATLQPAAGVFTARPRTSCAACGREVGRLEPRHMVEGAPFHTVCVPSRA